MCVCSKPSKFSWLLSTFLILPPTPPPENLTIQSVDFRSSTIRVLFNTGPLFTPVFLFMLSSQLGFPCSFPHLIKIFLIRRYWGKRHFLSSPHSTTNLNILLVHNTWFIYSFIIFGKQFIIYMTSSLVCRFLHGQVWVSLPTEPKSALFTLAA